jgi:hypothetical protein
MKKYYVEKEIIYEQLHVQYLLTATGMFIICSMCLLSISFSVCCPINFQPYMFPNDAPSSEFKASSANNVRKWSIWNRPLHTVPHFTDPHHNILIIHRINTKHWNKKFSPVRDLMHNLHPCNVSKHSIFRCYGNTKLYNSMALISPLRQLVLYDSVNRNKVSIR